MKAYAAYSRGILFMICVSVMFPGCARITVVNMLQPPPPQLQTGSPLRSVRPTIFAFKELSNTQETTQDRFIYDPPVTAVVATYIKNELIRNGHTCIPYAPDSHADYVIEGNIYNFVNSYGYYWVAVRLTATSVRDDKQALTRRYEGAFDDGMLSMVKRVSTDMELVDFLNQNNSQTEKIIGQ